MAASPSRVGAAEEGEGEAGCWVPYGWRHGLRRLPPPISLLRRLVRARTSDGRLVISRDGAAAQHHRVRGRKAEGRLVLGLAEGNDAAAEATARFLLRRRWSHPLDVAQDAVAFDYEAEEEDAECIRSSSPPPSSPLACSAVRAPSLGAMPANCCLPRMAH